MPRWSADCTVLNTRLPLINCCSRLLSDCHDPLGWQAELPWRTAEPAYTTLTFDAPAVEPRPPDVCNQLKVAELSTAELANVLAVRRDVREYVDEFGFTNRVGKFAV